MALDVRRGLLVALFGGLGGAAASRACAARVIPIDAAEPPAPHDVQHEVPSPPFAGAPTNMWIEVPVDFAYLDAHSTTDPRTVAQRRRTRSFNGNLWFEFPGQAAWRHEPWAATQSGVQAAVDERRDELEASCISSAEVDGAIPVLWELTLRPDRVVGDVTGVAPLDNSQETLGSRRPRGLGKLAGCVREVMSSAQFSRPPFNEAHGEPISVQVQLMRGP